MGETSPARWQGSLRKAFVPCLDCMCKRLEMITPKFPINMISLQFYHECFF